MYRKISTPEDTRNIVNEDDGKSIYCRPLIIPEEDDICDIMERLE